jgi:tetratricopeptide (TPR) repeat protein
MKRQTKLLLGLLVLLAMTATGCAKLQARDNLNRGVRAFREAHYENAVMYFKQAVELDPELTTAEIYLATAYAQQYVPGSRDPDNETKAQMAIQTFEKVLGRDASNVNAVAGLASIYQNLGQTDTKNLRKAHDYYVKYATLDSTNPVPFYAIGSLDWLIVYDKNSPPPLEEQATLIDEGLANLDKALALNPDYDDAMTYKNLLYREKSRLAADDAEKKKWTDMADEWFNKGLETRKKNAEKNKAIPVGNN